MTDINDNETDKDKGKHRDLYTGKARIIEHRWKTWGLVHKITRAENRTKQEVKMGNTRSRNQKIKQETEHMEKNTNLNTEQNTERNWVRVRVRVGISVSEGWMKCLSPQNTFGVSRVISVAGKSNAIEVTGRLILQTTDRKQNMPFTVPA